MKKIILFSLLLLINNNSISQVYKFSKKETAVYYLFDDSSKTDIPYSNNESLYNDFITRNDTKLGKYYINQVKFYEVSDSVKNKPDSVKGKNYYYLNPVVKELESYLKLNIRSNKFIDENEPGNLFDYTKEERLKNISENFSDVYDISEYVLVNYEKEFCNDCVLDVTKELIDYNIDEINKKEDIYNISNIEVIVLFKDKKSLLSIFGVKKIEVYLITNIETTEKQYNENGYMEYYNYFKFTNYDVIGFQPGRILVYGLM